jgi:UDP-N-acetylglucosamine pyrophosphorylase
MKVEKVNTKELLNHAFTVMKLLKSGALSVDEAKAQANLLKQSNNILKYELDKAIAIQKFENISIKDIED